MPYLKVRDVAEYLKLSERTVYKLVREGTLPAVRIGGTYRIDDKELDRWMKTQSPRAKRGRAIDAQRDEDFLWRIAQEPDRLKKRLLFMGLVTDKLADKDGKPVVVGGMAVEFYTAGGYATADIDLVYPSEPLDAVLMELGLRREGRYWYSEEMGIVVEAPDAFLDAQAKEHLVDVKIDDFSVLILGVEDLIVDRLNAFVHWKSSDDGNWARELIAIHDADIDWAYLEIAASENKVGAALKKLTGEVREGKDKL